MYQGDNVFCFLFFLKTYKPNLERGIFKGTVTFLELLKNFIDSVKNLK